MIILLMVEHADGKINGKPAVSLMLFGGQLMVQLWWQNRLKRQGGKILGWDLIDSSTRV